MNDYNELIFNDISIDRVVYHYNRLIDIHNSKFDKMKRRETNVHANNIHNRNCIARAKRARFNNR